MNNQKYRDIQRRFFSHTNPHYLKIKKTRDRLNEINSIVSNYSLDNDLFALEYEDLCNILTNSEFISLEVRSALALKEDDIYLSKDKKKNEVNLEVNLQEHKEVKRELAIKKIHKSLDNLPVDVKIEDGLVEVHTPLTFKRGYKKSNYIDNYLLSYYVEAALKKWEDDNQKKLYKLLGKQPYICILKRTDIDFSIFKNCDGDNLENQRIINTITHALTLPDDARYMSLYTTFEITKDIEKTGTTFYIFTQNDFENYKHLMIKTSD